MRCWDPRMEEMPADELKRLQFKLLKTLIYRVYSFSAFYHQRMKEAGVHPDDISALSDISRLPFMFKKDLRDNYPDGLIMSEPEELVRYHVSSGTTGKPTIVGYTAMISITGPNPWPGPSRLPVSAGGMSCR